MLLPPVQVVHLLQVQEPFVFFLCRLLDLRHVVHRAGTRADIDLTEIFLNFMLDRAIRAFARVDLTKFYPEELTLDLKLLWERWER